ncbi:MAG: peptide chain release factor N(5)-glutamine methyltransferase [Rhodospirillales bacterium]|nr:peptide chain release factor N(5)-glutamine methyltransferase [Rhodospirillales bacterium]
MKHGISNNTIEIPPTIGDAAQAVAKELKASGVESSRLDARLLVSHAAGVAPETYLTNPERELDAAARDRITGLMLRRMLREPMSHILGEREFWSMAFDVTPDTLTPRPDTECLVESVLTTIRKLGRTDDLSILDLGTGTGCILLALLSELPGAHGLGIDISADALCVAQQNASRHGLDSRAEFKVGDWFAPVEGMFDVIVSNPPYIESNDIVLLDPEVAKHEPWMALDGGPDGLMCYREICSTASMFLDPEGVIALEVGSEQSGVVENILIDSGFSAVRVQQDLAGRNRVVMATCPKL